MIKYGVSYICDQEKECNKYCVPELCIRTLDESHAKNKSSVFTVKKLNELFKVKAIVLGDKIITDEEDVTIILEETGVKNV